MAYNYPYLNANYTPPAAPQMTPPAPMFGGMPFGQPAAQSNVSWVYVAGVQGAREHIVQPGQTAWMMDNNEPVIYVKAVDTMGTATLKCFRLTEITPEAGGGTAAPQVDMSQYATRAEVEAVAGKVDKLLSEMGGLNV